jgi:hypothetical protein
MCVGASSGLCAALPCIGCVSLHVTDLVHMHAPAMQIVSSVCTAAGLAGCRSGKDSLHPRWIHGRCLIRWLHASVCLARIALHAFLHCSSVQLVGSHQLNRCSSSICGSTVWQQCRLQAVLQIGLGIGLSVRTQSGTLRTLRLIILSRAAARAECIMFCVESNACRRDLCISLHTKAA